MTNNTPSLFDKVKYHSANIRKQITKDYTLRSSAFRPWFSLHFPLPDSLAVLFYFLLSVAFPDRHFYFPKTPAGALVPRSPDGRYESQRVVADPMVVTWSDSRFSITLAPRFSLGLPFCYGQRSRFTKRVFRRRCTAFYFSAVSFVRSRATRKST